MGITVTGAAELANLCGNVSTPVSFTYVACGTGTTAFSNAQTALVTEITDSGLERAAATRTRVTTTTANDTVQFAKTWTASGSKTVKEVGVFNDASAGIMLARTKLTSEKVLDSGDSHTLIYKIKFPATA